MLLGLQVTTANVQITDSEKNIYSKVINIDNMLPDLAGLTSFYFLLVCLNCGVGFAVKYPKDLNWGSNCRNIDTERQ